jgi:phosphatidate cytidylyltransferase
MSYLEPTEQDLRGARHRARHEEPAAPDAYPRPVELKPAEVPTPPNGNGRAGRNLPAAIAVGASLGAVVLVSLLFWRPGFVFVVATAAGIGAWEMARAMARDGGPRAPLVPLLAGSAVMVTLAWFAGAEALTLGLVVTVLAAMVWRLADGPAGYQRDLLAAVLVAVYVPFLGSFAVLLDRPSDGALRVIVMLAAVVLSDTGGYVAGVFLGRHAMAPTVSPKKSWEGTAGSLFITATGGAVLFHVLFHVPWWHGALFGLGVSAVAVLGDLAESLLKRDLHIKDMSHLLPGHGGLMDRLDSVLFAAPAAFVLFSVLVPAA